MFGKGQMREPAANEWVIVAYDLPNEPSKLRVRAWRNFKKLGAIYPPVSLCILPGGEQGRAAVGQLRSEISKNGTVLVMSASALDKQDVELLTSMFRDDRRRQYEEILEECQEFLDEIDDNLRKGKVTSEETDELEEALEALKKWYHGTREKRYAREEDASSVEQMLTKCAEALARFSDKAQPAKLNR